MGAKKLCYTRCPVPVTNDFDESADRRSRRRVLTAIERFGDRAISAQVVERGGYRYWFEGSSCVAYRLVGTTRVVAGEPLAAPADRGGVADRFGRDAREHGHRVVWFGVDDDFMARVRGVGLDVDALHVGAEPTWSLTQPHGRERGLASQCRRAYRKGVRVRAAARHELADPDSPLRRRIATLIEDWHATRPMPPMDFVVRVDPFVPGVDRRIYLAECRGRLEACLVAAAMPACRGWFFENILRSRTAPNGTIETLICVALDDATARGDAVASLGLAPLADIDVTTGPHRWLRFGLRACYRHLGQLYRFRSLHAFKARMRPHRWERRYIAVVGGRLGLRDVVAVLRAFAGGSLSRFLVAFVRRRIAAWLGATISVGSGPGVLQPSRAEPRRV